MGIPVQVKHLYIETAPQMFIKQMHSVEMVVDYLIIATFHQDLYCMFEGSVCAFQGHTK